MSHERFTFLAGEDEVSTAAPGWKLAIVDDDQAVHDGTRFALQNFVLNGQGVQLLSAHSAAEGLVLMRDNPDIAVVLLDVVMETEDAGLKLARAIRNDLKNDLVRIILRTGQPGQAPEHRVVVEYDINDYKAKTELTADKLYTTLTSALRSYDQLRRLDDTRAGLELIVSASSELFDHRSLEKLAHGVLLQLNALLSIEASGMLVLRETADSDYAVLASVGRFASLDLAPDFPHLFTELSAGGRPLYRDRQTHLYVRTNAGAELIVVIDTAAELNGTQSSLVDVFCAKLGGAFDNAGLHLQLIQANAALEVRVAERTTELAGANQRLTEQSAQLRRVNAFKNEILGTIAHDLKNPLAVVLGRAEMLSMLSGRLDATVAEPFLAQVGHLRSAAQRMTRIVDVSVADAMADAMDISINRRRIDMGAVVRTVADLNRNLADAKEQRFDVQIDAPLPVWCDPDRLAEAIDNLASNAIKYTPVGGTVEVRAMAEGNEIKVQISDSGPGLKPEDLVRLFGRFQRLSAQPTGGESSTGLGLSIVQKIVDLHEGRVDVEERGRLGGATFTIAVLRRPETSS